MFAQTSTAAATWHVVPAECKWFARLAVAKTVVKALGKGIKLEPPPLDPEVVKAATEMMDSQGEGRTRPDRAGGGESVTNCPRTMACCPNFQPCSETPYFVPEPDAF
jgi:hypothetical protein